MATLPLHSEQWDYVRTLLPTDLEQTAKAMHALVRCRNVPDAEALMRMALAYAVSDLSLKDVAAWAGAMKLAEITGPGLFYRLREAEDWLAHVLAQTLAAQTLASPMKWPAAGGRCHGDQWSWASGSAVAGSCACGPGHGWIPSRGAD